MRKTIGLMVVAWTLTMGAGAAQAQDATSIALQAAQQANDMAMQAAQTANQNAMQASMDSGMLMAAPRPLLPFTPRPVISALKGGVSVALYCVDPKAIVFYTMDGSLPTPRSQRYVGPIAVSSKLRVRAMAFDLEDMPSGVVSKTVRARS